MSGINFYDKTEEMKYSNSNISSINKIKYLFIQTEYCMLTLRDYIKNRNKKYFENTKNFTPDTNELWSITRQMIEGLNHIHNLGVVHRDLKTSNILIGLNKEIKIGDFGLAIFSKNETLIKEKDNKLDKNEENNKIIDKPEHKIKNEMTSAVGT